MADDRDRWLHEMYEPAVRRFPERKPAFETSSGIPLQPLYTESDAVALPGGLPGEPPFLRGIQPSMYRGRFWTMRQYAGFSAPEETNRRFRFLLEQGQTGLSVAFDLPTQTGYDSDHAVAYGEVGRVGVPIDTLRDMELLFEGIPLDKVTTSMTINATAAILLAMYLAVARKQGVGWARVGGTIQNDILKEYIARGTYIYPPEPSMRLITDIFRFCADEVPQWNTISVSGYHLREAGCTAAQEVGFTLADGIAYVEAALAAGLDVDAFAGRLSFFFACQSEFFEEVAKFRAARVMWADIMRERFGAKDPRSRMLRFHTQTAGVSLTAQQPLNNVVRTTLQALAAVLGGTQSLHTNSWDEALSLPSEEAARLALRTQQVIANESGVADVVDPLGGSYLVESLTAAVREKAQAYIDTVDRLGGAVRAVQAGYIQREVQESAYRHQQEVEAKRRVVVGVNQHVEDGAAAPPAFRLDPTWGQRQIARTQAVRAERDATTAAASLRAIETAARNGDNLMPHFIAAAEAYCTIGEQCDVLRQVWGEMREVLVL